MIKRTVEVSSNGSYLKVQNSQLLIEVEGQKKGSIPFEDLGVLVLSADQLCLTQKVLTEAAQSNTVVVVCDEKHTPISMVLPIYGNVEHTARLRAQLNMSVPRQKQAWRQVVQAKIAMQAANLPEGECKDKVTSLIGVVKSGDIENREAQAAKLYWKGLLGEGFSRSRDGDSPNNLLNYGYAILRATVARAICAGGLHPSLGIFHSNQYNPFCLADDLMEPFRPVVDKCVKALYLQGLVEVTKETKVPLLSTLTTMVPMVEMQSPLMVAIGRTIASFNHYIDGDTDQLVLPLGSGSRYADLGV